jgi:hypothetical protein
MGVTDPPTGSRLPRRVFFTLIASTVVAVAVVVAYSIVTGWVPPRSFATAYTGVVLPLYGAVLLAIVTLSFVVSGNTLMHHYRTGTVQRATDPTWFWWIVTVQSLIVVVLLVFGCVQWSKLHG